MAYGTTAYRKSGLNLPEFTNSGLADGAECREG